ncbi:hypothetical protein DI270_034325 [Microbispora triticiradicis]|uniref:Uncharacterized protein n=1 Tax=Microbispora triticiradicis TaxID=2200763 RepID=A0ABX9LA37_9ACTN|nr:hypothetical protein DI270_034325 [Microbispora triticiradicis]
MRARHWQDEDEEDASLSVPRLDSPEVDDSTDDSTDDSWDDSSDDSGEDGSEDDSLGSCAMASLASCSMRF